MKIKSDSDSILHDTYYNAVIFYIVLIDYILESFKIACTDGHSQITYYDENR